MGDTTARMRGAVAATCAALAPEVSLPAGDAVAAIARRVAATPSLVVTGPVSSGKSTLVNALVGRRVAPTGAGECTRLVAHYVRGPVDRLDVVLVDGSRRPLPLAPGGRVPAAVGDRLGVDPEDVDHLVVTLTSAALDGLTVVDTPGTGSAHASRGAVTSAAEAALVVLPATAGPGDVDALDAAEVLAGGPAGVIAVLGRADTVGDDVGTGTALDLGRRLGDRVGPVSPVVGLLAETAVTGALRTEDVRALAALAGAEQDVLDDALLDPELFVAADLGVAGVGAQARLDLLELLDRRGVALAVARLRAAPETGVGELRELLLAASGLDRLVQRLDEEVRARIDLLTARAAVRRLAALGEVRPTPGGGTARDGEQARDAAADLARGPGFDGADLVAVQARLRSGALALPGAPDDVLDEIDRLVGLRAGDAGARPGGAAGVELAAQAARRAAWWRSYAGWGSPRRVAEAAHVVHRAYAGLWRELTAP